MIRSDISSPSSKANPGSLCSLNLLAKVSNVDSSHWSTHPSGTIIGQCKSEKYVASKSRSLSLDFYTMESLLSTEGSHNLNNVESSTTLSISLHKYPITHVRLIPDAILTASRDVILIWPLSLSSSSSRSPIVVRETLGTLSLLEVDARGHWMAAVVDDKIFSIHLQSGEIVCFEGHLGNVTCCTFLYPGNYDSSMSDNTAWLVTGSEDRTFKIWDLDNKTCIYQSSILSSASVTCLAIDPECFCMSCGFDDGVIRIFDMTTRKTTLACEPRLIHTIHGATLSPDAHKNYEEESSTGLKDTKVHVVNSLPEWRRQSTIANQDEEEHPSPEVSTVSLSLLKLAYASLSLSEYDRSLLLAGFHFGFILFSTNSYVPLYMFDFRTMDIPLNRFSVSGVDSHERVHSQPAIGIVDRYDMCPVDGYSEGVLLSVSNRMDRSLIFLHLEPTVTHSTGQLNAHSRHNSDVPYDSSIPLLSNVEKSISKKVPGDIWAEKLLKNCLLELHALNINDEVDVNGKETRIQESRVLPGYVKSLLLEASRSKAAVSGETIRLFPSPNDAYIEHPLLAKGSPKSTPKKKSAVKDQPVTFRSNVKSSGYSSQPTALKMFQRPKIGSPSKKKDTPTSKGTPSRNVIEYPMDCPPLSAYQSTSDVIPRHRSSITGLRYHPSGKYFATCSADKTARIFKTPIVKNQIKDLVGHDAGVCHLSWGNQITSSLGAMLLTSSLEGKIRLWSSERSDPLLIFQNISGVASSGSGTPKKLSNTTMGTSPSTPKIFTASARQCRFHYRDAIIAIPNLGKIHLYTYHMDTTASNSVKPQLNYNKYKLVKTLSCSGQSITALNCVNTAQSPYLFAASSEKKVYVWDTIACKSVLTIHEAHIRPVHDIGLADYGLSMASTGSIFSHVFATIAITDGIRLWDLRSSQGKPISALHGHVNRFAMTQLSLSPCGRYLATGSEDHHAYVFDVRMGKGLLAFKTGRNHGETVSAVDFHPVKAELATGSYQGVVSLFAPESL